MARLEPWKLIVLVVGHLCGSACSRPICADETCQPIVAGIRSVEPGTSYATGFSLQALDGRGEALFTYFRDPGADQQDGDQCAGGCCVEALGTQAEVLGIVTSSPLETEETGPLPAVSCMAAGSSLDSFELLQQAILLIGVPGFGAGGAALVADLSQWTARTRTEELAAYGCSTFCQYDCTPTPDGEEECAGEQVCTASPAGCRQLTFVPETTLVVDRRILAVERSEDHTLIHFLEQDLLESVIVGTHEPGCFGAAPQLIRGDDSLAVVGAGTDEQAGPQLSCSNQCPHGLAVLNTSGVVNWRFESCSPVVAAALGPNGLLVAAIALTGPELLANGTTLQPMEEEGDLAIVLFDAAGMPIWATQIPGANPVLSHHIVAIGGDGEVYALLYASGVLRVAGGELAPGDEGGTALLRFSMDGVLEFASLIGLSKHGDLPMDRVTAPGRALEIDDEGGVWIRGATSWVASVLDVPVASTDAVHHFAARLIFPD